jgi:4-diphosphocytidyl-2-C-methyl-D-erythritol kinase
MQTIDLADQLELSLEGAGLVFSCDDPALVQDNLAVKAATAFYEELGSSPALRINLRKRIPYGAGLGGGSSDAAAVLRGLNFLYQDRLSQRQLWEIARRLGADVPFFLYGGRALCTGIGDVITPLPCSGPDNYLLLKPPFSLASRTVYAMWDQYGPAGTGEYSAGANNYLPEGKNDIKYNFMNELEPIVQLMYKDLAGIKKELYELGADTVAMSGSGSALFAVFARSEQANEAELIVKNSKPEDWWIRFCKSIPAAGLCLER